MIADPQPQTSLLRLSVVSDKVILKAMLKEEARLCVGPVIAAGAGDDIRDD